MQGPPAGPLHSGHVHTSSFLSVFRTPSFVAFESCCKCKNSCLNIQSRVALQRRASATTIRMSFVFYSLVSISHVVATCRVVDTCATHHTSILTLLHLNAHAQHHCNTDDGGSTTTPRRRGFSRRDRRRRASSTLVRQVRTLRATHDMITDCVSAACCNRSQEDSEHALDSPQCHMDERLFHFHSPLHG